MNSIEDKQMTDINQWIDNEVKTNDVVLFMKGTPDMPMCGFSGRSVQILQHVGVPFKGINVLDSAELRQGIKDYTNWPTIPQLYVKGEFVGGSDILMEMFQSGELKHCSPKRAWWPKARPAFPASDQSAQPSRHPRRLLRL